MLTLRFDSDCILLAVHATPGARREGVGGQHDGALRIAVRSAAEGGRANRRLIEVLAKTIGLPKRDIAITSGETARRKKMKIGPLSDSQRTEICGKLAELAESH